MFTNNYLLMRKALFEFDGARNKFVGYFYDPSGAIHNEYLYPLAASDIGNWMKYARCKEIVARDPNNINVSESTYAGVYFGSGSKSPTREDYALHEPITSGLEITNTNALAWSNDGPGNYSVCSDYVVRNITDNDIVIREIGIFTPGGGNTTGSANHIHYLMERTVLDDPIVIPSHEARLVSYIVRFNQSAT